MFGRQVRRVVNRTVAEPRLPIRVVFEQRRLCTSISSVSLHAHRTTIMNSQRSIQIQAIRWFSSRGGRRSNTKRDSGFQLDALPFSISPEQALESFHRWAKDDQGLSYLISSQSIRIGAAYCPVWSFDINARFVLVEKNDTKTTRRFDWKPSAFAIYGSQPVIHIPGLAAYAGHTYRRSLVNPIHNTSLVFLGSQTVPFQQWMLRDMELSNGARLTIFPDPWNTTRGRALTVVREQMQALADAEKEHVSVQSEVLKSRRVYMPTYTIEYSVFGVTYQAFVSGCDTGAGVSGISHRVWGGLGGVGPPSPGTAHSFLSQAAGVAQTSARVLGGQRLGILIVSALQLLGSILTRVLVRVPLIGAVAGVFVGFRKILQPWLNQRWSTAAWERQREREAVADDWVNQDNTDDFVDSGNAVRYFQSNRGRILKHLSGEYDHERGEYDWYKEWEKWARQQWEQQQQHHSEGQQHHSEGQQRQRQQGQRVRQKTKPEYQWDFDPQDPYSVLGVSRGSSKKELSTAFRREMLKWHPDTIGPGASEALRERATERSKIITDAYRKIKTQVK